MFDFDWIQIGLGSLIGLVILFAIAHNFMPVMCIPIVIAFGIILISMIIAVELGY